MERYRFDVRDAVPSTLHESADEILWVTYRWMSLGLALTGLVAWLVAQSPGAVEMFVNNRVVFCGLMFAQLGLVVAFSTPAARVSAAAAAAMFFSYAGLTGL